MHLNLPIINLFSTFLPIFNPYKFEEKIIANKILFIFLFLLSIIMKKGERMDELTKPNAPGTEEFIFNQTMLRIKDPEISLDFYVNKLGMTLIKN